MKKIEVFVSAEKVSHCVMCGEEFQQKIQVGRPRQLCYERTCRLRYQARHKRNRRLEQRREAADER